MGERGGDGLLPLLKICPEGSNGHKGGASS